MSEKAVRRATDEDGGAEMPEATSISLAFLALKACLKALDQLPRDEAQRVVNTLASFYEVPR